MICGSPNLQDDLVFSTILPPNSPSCSNDHNDNDWLISADSYHSGGANAAFCDGSVRFITEMIDYGEIDKILGGTANTLGYAGKERVQFRTDFEMTRLLTFSSFPLRIAPDY